jgi:hypothetical protein
MRPDENIPYRRELPRAAAPKEHLVAELGSWDAIARRRRRRFLLVVVPAVGTGRRHRLHRTRPSTSPRTWRASAAMSASLDANVAVVGADERTLADVCGDVWRTGAFGEEGAPPQLTACVLPTGAVGVFPGAKTTCSGLGLAELPASYAGQMKGFAGLQAAVVAKLGEPPSGSSRGGPECVSEGDARLIVQRELDLPGYSDWKVETAGEFMEARPCADVSFDTGGKTVLLVPGSR